MKATKRLVTHEAAEKSMLVWAPLLVAGKGLAAKRTSHTTRARTDQMTKAGERWRPWRTKRWDSVRRLDAVLKMSSLHRSTKSEHKGQSVINMVT
jgi:hypothetical protein